MAARKDSGLRFAVVCDDWKVERATKWRSRKDAERAKEQVEALGACRLPHRIVEVVKR